MKKILAALTAVVAFFSLTTSVQAAQLQNASVKLDDSSVGINTDYTFYFKHTSGATLNKVLFEFCQKASGDCGTNPSTGTSTGVTLSSVTGLPQVTTPWTIDTLASGKLTILNANPQVVTGGTDVSIKFSGIANGSLEEGVNQCWTAGAPNQPANSATCYIWITTYNGTTVVDTTVVTYTRVASVTISAKVDPTFTFVVNGVNTGVPVNSGAITTTVSSAYNTLPFGNLTVGVPKYAAHMLTVKTNTTTGYTVSSMVRTQIKGVYTDNNIDPFIAPYGAPTSWTSPTGSTANDNTGWFGFNTSDTDVASNAYGGVAKFGGLDTNAQIVMSNTKSDNGTVPVYVTYALEANVFQPSDTYSGVLVYNALPTY